MLRLQGKLIYKTRMCRNLIGYRWQKFYLQPESLVSLVVLLNTKWAPSINNVSHTFDVGSDAFTKRLLICRWIFALINSEVFDFIDHVFFFRYGGFAFGMPLPPDLQMDLTAVPKNRTLSKVTLSPASLLPVSLSL